jgi:dCTP deaminase
MTLSDSAILEAINDGIIEIKPFNVKSLGSNSYDVHLSKYIATYESSILDAKKHNRINHFEILEEGYVLNPNRIYLASIQEYTYSKTTVPVIHGKSSIGRLGIDIHATAGFGDVGFRGYFTLELSVKQPVRIYSGMPIGQIEWREVVGVVNNPYDKKNDAKYSNQGIKPVESKMYKNFL